MSQLNETALVTGATGFIALHVVDLLLSQGYKVVGTARSEAKGEHLLTNFKASRPDAQLSYEIVPDIGEADAFDHVFKKHPEINVVLHTASPVIPTGSEDAVEHFFKAAVGGTLNILEAIKKYAPQVNKFVLTSSIASMFDFSLDITKEVITEESWNKITLDDVKASTEWIVAYIASKAFGEKAARKFVEEEKPNYTFTTVHPLYVLGPQVFTDILKKRPIPNTGQSVIDVLESKEGEKPTEIGVFSFVDVRDIAKLHLLPLTDPKLNGKRLLGSNDDFGGIDIILLTILKNFPEYEGKIYNPGKSVQELIDSAVLLKNDNTVTRELTGINFIPLEKTVVDEVKQYLEFESQK